MEHQSSIKSAVINELLRIILFLFYYVSLIGIGAAILIGAIKVSHYLIMDILPALQYIRSIILIVMAVIGICLLALMLGIYLIKPLFSFSKNTKNSRIEVFESECPELFRMIKDLARQTQCQMPKHVYLSPDVNACVFYDTSFWSIFFPIKKNLEIGLGLFDGTSVDEVKSIIAHEFGHFSQKSMKIGSSVYITNSVLYNLIFTDDFWDRWLDRWCMSEINTLRYFGVATRVMTNLIKQVTAHMYRFVQKGYLKLSRHMEYDADSIACQSIGTNTFISALCKIEVLANKNDLYHQMLETLMNEQKMVSNYFTGNDIVSGLIPNKELPHFSFDCELKEPVRTYSLKSRVEVQDIWASHPSLEDRIANVSAENGTLGSTSRPISSRILIPKHISEKVSTLFMTIIRNNAQEPLTVISDEEFAEWTSNEIKENFMDERLRPFFGNRIFEFDLEKSTDVPLESPFTVENAQKIAELISGINDFQLLNQVKNNEIDVKEVKIDGIVYNRKNIPLEKFKTELKTIHEKVLKIYSDIYAYVHSKCDEDKRDIYYNSFTALFYAQYLKCELLPPLFAHRNNLLNELNKATKRNEQEYEQLCFVVREYEKHLKKIISELDLDWIAVRTDTEDFVNKLREYVNTAHNSRYQIDTDTINEMFHITESLSDIQNIIYETSRGIICNITTNVLNNTEG